MLYEVNENFEVMYRSGKLALTVCVPKGTLSDLASVPPFFWRVIPPGGKYNVAAVVHDYLYETKCDRRLADSIFRMLMEEAGVPRWKCRLMHWAVRLFGRQQDVIR